MKHPTDTLSHEHDIIKLVLNGAEREARSVRETGAVDQGRIRDIIEFFSIFADRCHHAKEEKHLFPRLGMRGLPESGGPVEVMLREHVEGRGYVRDMANALKGVSSGDRNAAGQLAEALEKYVALLRVHIDKEDYFLFVAADYLLTDSDKAEIAAAFDKVETEEIGEDVHEKFHRLAHQLNRPRS